MKTKQLSNNRFAFFTLSTLTKLLDNMKNILVSRIQACGKPIINVSNIETFFILRLIFCEEK
jgi:hypothetical protein